MVSRVFAVIGLLFAGFSLSGAQTLRYPLPFEPEEFIRELSKRKDLPENLKVSEENGALKFELPPGSGFKTVEISREVQAPEQAAGIPVNVSFQVKADRLRPAKGGKTSPVKVTVAGSAVKIPKGSFNWRTVGTGIRIPAGGKVKIQFTLRSGSGTVWIKSPAAEVAMPGKLPGFPR